jgi:hypothetical protein
MCGRVIQSSGPLRYGIVEGMDMRDSRVHNYPPRWNGARIIRKRYVTGSADSNRIADHSLPDITYFSSWY